MAATLRPDCRLRRGRTKTTSATGRPRPALLDALLETQPTVDVDEAFAHARQAMTSFSGVDQMTAPATFKGTLREYQREALGWFDFLRRFGFGGCLADDMGLGKTVMVLALLESRACRPARSRGRRLVASYHARSSSTGSPRRDDSRPKLRVLDYTGPDARTPRSPTTTWSLTTYGTLRRDAIRALRGWNSTTSSSTKRRRSRTPRSGIVQGGAAAPGGRHRLALSGTPIENHIGELWSLFEFLNPGHARDVAARSADRR